jgi:hypothetical protein
LVDSPAKLSSGSFLSLTSTSVVRNREALSGANQEWHTRPAP